MPTAAKMSAAIMLAALAWLVSDLIRPLMPETTIFGWFNYVNSALALIVGWRVIGVKAGDGLFMAISNGITAVAVLVFVGLLAHSVYEVLHLSVRGMYSNPLSGLEGLFRIAAEYVVIILDPSVAGTLIVGGIAVAIITEVVNSVWR